MKNLLFALVLMNVFNANLSDITRAISSGDADALGQYFDQTVEVSILEEEGVYDKAKAVSVVKQFFAKNAPKSFSQVHQGTSKGADSQYCIGNMTTNGTTYRVYIYMKVSGGKYLIQELRFDEE